MLLARVMNAGWAPCWEQRQQPRRRAAREETQNNHQGNPTQNKKLASTNERSLLESRCLRAGVGQGGEKRVSKGDSVPLWFQRILSCKQNSAGEQCGYFQCFQGIKLICFFFLIESKLEWLLQTIGTGYRRKCDLLQRLKNNPK